MWKTIIFSPDAKVENFSRWFMAHQDYFGHSEEAEHFLGCNSHTIKPFSHLASWLSIIIFTFVIKSFNMYKKPYYICWNFHI